MSSKAEKAQRKQAYKAGFVKEKSIRVQSTGSNFTYI